MVFRLAIGIVATVLAVALAVGWQILVVSDFGSTARGFTPAAWWFLILGSIFFGLVILGLVLLCAWLIREMRHNQRQQAFLDAVTHEMKTPLASLRLALDTLRRHDPDPERRAAFLGMMDEDVERLDRTVDHVLAAARAEGASRGRPVERIELRELLLHCIEQVRELHQLEPAAIRLEPDRAALVRGDEAELGLVFRNLLENAVKYSDPPVEVRVGITDAGERRVRVQIADQGIGIPQGELRKIFQRFYRAGRDVQRRAAGLGLGLFIVRDLVRRHGGRVEALSEGAGRGSRFVVTLRAAGS
jgi:signal transduction histidine kinase